ncbi:MAG: YciI family protein [Wenzhouxiangella sp.]|nr:MAG: YciI family protein [Wenzhouxiangella sp.]
MYYCIIGYDVEDSLARRSGARADHLDRLHGLCSAGRLLTAGPLPAIDSPDPGPAGFAGSLIIAEFSSMEEAQRWADADPYILSGAWSGTEVHPYKAVLP